MCDSLNRKKYDAKYHVLTASSVSQIRFYYPTIVCCPLCYHQTIAKIYIILRSVYYILLLLVP